MKNTKITLLALTTASSFALPIDWHGEFQVDTNQIENYTRTKKAIDSSNNGSQEIELAGGNKSSAAFETYIIKLKPELIINDSTTFKGEITTGYGHGGRNGESSASKKAGSTNFTNALYTYDTVSSNQLNLTQAYATFYADTATYKVGRQSSHWALGALHNDGEKNNSRFATIRDGVTIDFKIGNFTISPYYAKLSSRENLTKAARVKETGIKLFYNNLDTDFAFGLLYATNSASNFAKLETDVSGTTREMGLASVKITDIYLKKAVGDFTTEVEIPLLSGDLGKIVTADDDASYKASAFLVNNTYKINNSHTLALNLGKVSGDSGAKSSYEALFLNPNFQVANLLFKYNLSAVKNTDQNIYDSYITNAFYVKFAHTYYSNNWSWENAVIWAKAEEVAKNGQNAYNHLKNKYFLAAADQDSSLGFEIDSNLNYKWNTAVTISGGIGYLFTGDYFAFNNTATPGEVQNSYILSGAVNLSF